MTTPSAAPSPPSAPPPTDPGPTRVFRSTSDRVVAGVCGGLGAHLGVDPVLLRLAFVALTLAGGAGVLAYVVAWIVIPEAEPGLQTSGTVHDAARTQMLIGAGILALGAFLLFDEFLPMMGAFFWPLVLIAIGAAVLLRGERR